jgi:hypothetical protein
MRGFAAPRRRVVNIVRITVLGCAALTTSPANTPVVPLLVLPAPLRQLHDLFPVAPISELQHVWRAEEGDSYEVYSNGLRIENTFVAPSRTRGQYFAYRRVPGTWGVIRHPAFSMANPAGIVFHQTESLQAAFEPSQARRLTRIGQELLEFVRRRHCYHFVVELRPGMADRAGDRCRVSFRALGVGRSGEGVREPELVVPGCRVGIRRQRNAFWGAGHSLRLLVEWLRNRYSIPASNCVAHAEGFRDRFEKALRGLRGFPLKISEVRLAQDPLYSTAKGALVAALSEA